MNSEVALSFRGEQFLSEIPDSLTLMGGEGKTRKTKTTRDWMMNLLKILKRIVQEASLMITMMMKMIVLATYSCVIGFLMRHRATVLSLGKVINSIHLLLIFIFVHFICCCYE